MTSTRTSIFDTTIQESEQWIDEIGQEVGSEDARQAYHALRSTLQTLRDRLPVAEAADLGAQLPMLIRGIYYEGWRPADTPQKLRDKQEFLDEVRERYNARPAGDFEGLVKATLKVMVSHISQGESRHVISDLPDKLSDLWPQ